MRWTQAVVLLPKPHSSPPSAGLETAGTVRPTILCSGRVDRRGPTCLVCSSHNIDILLHDPVGMRECTLCRRKTYNCELSDSPPSCLHDECGRGVEVVVGRGAVVVQELDALEVVERPNPLPHTRPHWPILPE